MFLFFNFDSNFPNFEEPKNHIKTANNIILIIFQMESYIFLIIYNENIGRYLNKSIILIP